MWVRHIGFDLDGTLIDTRAQIVESIEACVEPAKRLEARTIAEAGFAGSPLTILRRFGFSDLRSYWMHHARRCDRARLFFPETRSALKRLRAGGISLSIVTSLPDGPAHNLLRATGLVDLFELIDTHSSRRSRKPSPALLKEHLAELRIRPGDSAYLGDAAGDVRMARGAGVRGWGVSWGNTDQDVLLAAGAELIVDHIDDLVDVASQARQP